MTLAEYMDWLMTQLGQRQEQPPPEQPDWLQYYLPPTSAIQPWYAPRESVGKRGTLGVAQDAHDRGIAEYMERANRVRGFASDWLDDYLARTRPTGAPPQDR